METIEFKRKIEEFISSGYGNDIFIENKVVYVHQLQHALRLAGVEKGIKV